jgi:hypothetical protein
MQRVVLAIVLVLTCLVGFSPASGAADWWGTKLPEQPTNFIFGYGSLINTASRNSTAAAPIAAIPVRVSSEFGYIRTWNDRSASGFTALGLRRPGPGEKALTINGVLYPVEGSDMSKFDEREAGYVRVEVPLPQIEALGWQQLPASGHIWVYVPMEPVEKGGTGLPGVGLPQPSAAFPLLESYIDVVVEGGLEYGKEYARELIETTDGWGEYWLNDRELARRPWVHDTKSGAVDGLLQNVSQSAIAFKQRMFPEVYAERWLPAVSK